VPISTRAVAARPAPGLSVQHRSRRSSPLDGQFLVRHRTPRAWLRRIERKKPDHVVVTCVRVRDHADACTPRAPPIGLKPGRRRQTRARPPSCIDPQRRPALRLLSGWIPSLGARPGSRPEMRLLALSWLGFRPAAPDGGQTRPATPAAAQSGPATGSM